MNIKFSINNNYKNDTVIEVEVDGDEIDLFSDRGNNLLGVIGKYYRIIDVYSDSLSISLVSTTHSIDEIKCRVKMVVFDFYREFPNEIV